MDVASIRARVDALRAAPKLGSVFGSGGHGFVRLPVWSEERTRAFEQRHAITLPADYRAFLREVGGGGAGPGYGLYEPGIGDRGESWESEGTLVLSRPFPHRERWNLSEEQVAALGVNGDGPLDDVYFTPDVVCGSMPIATLGCTQFVLLVVSGEQRGRLWLDDRGADAGVFPLNLDFAAWYEEWLDECERALGIAAPAR